MKLLPCGHVTTLSERKRCWICDELDHTENINKAIKLRIKPRGLSYKRKARP